MTRALIRHLLSSSPDVTRSLHAEHVNPAYGEGVGLLGFGRDLVRAEGVRVIDAEGREILDFAGGDGASALGHGHPDVRAALEEALGASVPHFLPADPQPLKSALAERLAELAPGDLSVTTLTSSNAEALEAALRLARAATRRPRFLAAERAPHPGRFHAFVPYGELAPLEKALRRRDVAAFVVEPVQVEGGIRLPPPGYLVEAARLCRRAGTLLVADETVTGLGRTGLLWACEHEGVEPDALLLGNGLSGGVAPVAALLTRRDLLARAWSRLDGEDLAGGSAFAGGTLACAAALATLEVLRRDALCAHAAQVGRLLGERLAAATSARPLVREVRGRGLLWGIELSPPAGAALVAEWVVMAMWRRGFFTRVCSGAPHVLALQPPLLMDRAGVEALAAGLEATLTQDAPGTVVSLARAATAVLRGTVTRFLEA